MTLHRTPEDHDADPPASWQVVKVSSRSWHLVSSLSTEAVFEYCATRQAAEAARTSGTAAALYEKEGRWFRGEQVDQWKPYAQVAAERQRRATWMAGKLGCRHATAGEAPYGDLDDTGSGHLMTALGETSASSDANHGFRVELLCAYREAWERTAGQPYPGPGGEGERE